jgi:3'-5' exoribonuclease
MATSADDSDSPNELVDRGVGAGPGARPAADESPPDRLTIAALREGDRVDGLLACARKAVLNATKSGRAFLAVVLRDGKDSIQGRSFENVDWLAEQFERGDVVRVRGKVARYREQLQIWVDAIWRWETTDSTEFLPVTYRDVEELDGFLEHLAREHVYQRGYRELLRSLLVDGELRSALRRAPCTQDGHHAYLGGLLEHTVSVAMLAAELCEVHPRLDRDLLVAAALVHDLGHTRAFTYAGEILPSEAGRLVGHLELGLEILRMHAGRTQLPERSWQALAHCVLAHHGPGVVPSRTFALPEALALCRINTVDVDIKQAFETRHWVDLNW